MVYAQWVFDNPEMQRFFQGKAKSAQNKWSICNKVLENGMKFKLFLYRFLEEALIRIYGRAWYNKLVKLLY